MPTIQMNTRIAKGLKEQGDAVLLRYGHTPSTAVQSLWTFIASHNQLPSFMEPRADAGAKAARQEQISAQAGIASRLFAEQFGLLSEGGSLSSLQDDALREAEWEDRGAFRE